MFCALCGGALPSDTLLRAIQSGACLGEWRLEGAISVTLLRTHM